MRGGSGEDEGCEGECLDGLGSGNNGLGDHESVIGQTKAGVIGYGC